MHASYATVTRQRSFVHFSNLYFGFPKVNTSSDRAVFKLIPESFTSRRLSYARHLRVKS
jgi:hypothetical protein